MTTRFLKVYIDIWIEAESEKTHKKTFFLLSKKHRTEQSSRTNVRYIVITLNTSQSNDFL